MLSWLMGVETSDQSEPVRSGGVLITDSGLGERTPCHEDLCLSVSLCNSASVNLHFLKGFHDL